MQGIGFGSQNAKNFLILTQGHISALSIDILTRIRSRNTERQIRFKKLKFHLECLLGLTLFFVTLRGLLFSRFFGSVSRLG